MKHLLRFLIVVVSVVFFPYAPTGHAQDMNSATSDRAVMRLGRGRATSLAWRPDGEVLAVGTGIGVVLLDGNFQELGRLEDATGYVLGITWSHDGTHLAVSSRDLDRCWMRVWAISDSTANEISLSSDICGDTALEWSASDRWLAFFDEDNRLYIADTTTIRPDAMHFFTTDINDIDWHPSGDQLAIAYDDNSVRVLDMTEEAFRLEIEDAGTAVAWSPDGTEFVTVVKWGTKPFLASNGIGLYHATWYAYHAIRTWNSETGIVQREIEIEGHNETQTSLNNIDWLSNNYVGGDCRILTEIFLGYDVCLWDLETGVRAGTYFNAGGSSSGGNLRWSPDYTRFIVPLYWRNSYTKVYRRGHGEIEGIVGGLYAVWTPDSRFVTAIDSRGQLIQYEADTHNVDEYPLFDEPAYGLRWSPDGRNLAVQSWLGGDSADVNIWNLETRQITSAFDVGIAQELEWASNEQIVTSWTFHSANVELNTRYTYRWDAATGELLDENEYPNELAHLEGISFASWNSERSIAAYGNGDSLVQFTDGSSFDTGLATVDRVIWSPDSDEAAIIGTDAESAEATVIEIWSLSEQTRIGRFTLTRQLMDFIWNFDGTALVIVTQQTEDYDITGWFLNRQVEIFDVRSGQHRLIGIYRVNNVVRDFFRLTWSPDGEFIAASLSESSVGIFDAKTGNVVVALPNYRTTSLAWRQDGQLLAGGSLDGTIRIWNTSDLIEQHLN
jgi:WD40 repeat protein